MKGIREEMNKFVESISEKEFKNNPRLRRKVQALLKSLELLEPPFSESRVFHKGITRYLSPTMLRS